MYHFWIQFILIRSTPKCIQWKHWFKFSISNMKLLYGCKNDQFKPYTQESKLETQDNKRMKIEKLNAFHIRKKYSNNMRCKKDFWPNCTNLLLLHLEKNFICHWVLLSLRFFCKAWKLAKTWKLAKSAGKKKRQNKCLAKYLRVKWKSK